MDSDTPSSSDPKQATVLENLGSALRDARQSRGLERAALASKLHMGEEQLTAIEEADLARLPEPVFIIAQSRRIAAALGLDIDPFLAPLKQASTGQSLTAGTAGRSSSGSVAWSLPGPGRRTGAAGLGHSPDGLHAGRLLGGAALVAGLVGAVLWAWPQLQRQLTGPLNNRPPASPTAAATGPSRATVGSKPGAVAPAGVLVLRTSQPSWLEVHDSSHKVLFKGTVQGERSFPVGQGLKVLAGRPDLVLVSLGGSSPRPLGRIDQIRWQSFPEDTTTPQPGVRAATPAAPAQEP
jgi:cytoskeleton protein RodZ